MTLLDPGQSAGTPTKEHHSGLIAVVAILAVVLLALGAWLVIDSQREDTRLPEATDAPGVEQGSARVADGKRFIGSGSCTIADDVSFTCVYDMADDRVSGMTTRGHGSGDPGREPRLAVAPPPTARVRLDWAAKGAPKFGSGTLAKVGGPEHNESARLPVPTDSETQRGIGKPVPHQPMPLHASPVFMSFTVPHRLHSR